jgi:arabinogalactan endo-1,4-beta-galactosidase
MKKQSFIITLFCYLLITGCSKPEEQINTSSEQSKQTSEQSRPSSLRVAANFAKGADVSWLTEMEDKGWKFRKADSFIEQDIFITLRNKGINSIRLRVFVNPSDKWCNQADVIAKAKRAKAAGMRIMIDFHYSDVFADPIRQTIPSAWKSYSFTLLYTAVYNHTKNVLTELKNNGITPEWVQVGNETNDGILWPIGRVTNKGNDNWTDFKNFAWLQLSGYNGVKDVFPNAKVILHIGDSTDNALFVWILEGMWRNGAKWDVIGMSHYPTPDNWFSMNAKCLANMNELIKRYKSEIMICETGMTANKPATTELFLNNIIANNKKLADGRGIGVFYWEPECYGDWKKYYKGAFNDSGQPSTALDAFKIN